MITRFFADNYKCLVGFDYTPKPLELIIGSNGSGKTTMFEALEKVKQFAFFGNEVGSIFDFEQLNRWEEKGRTNQEMRFELSVRDGDDNFEYVLVVNLDAIITVSEENLLINGNEVVISKTRWLNTYPHISDNPYDNERTVTMAVRGETKTFPVSHASQSILLLSSPIISRFISILSKIHTVSLIPKAMSSEVTDAEEGQKYIKAGFDNFASYYARALQEKPASVSAMRAPLAEVVDGLSSLFIERSQFGGKSLVATFENTYTAPQGKVSYYFHELSEGQRVLIALYALLFCEVGEGSTLLIDEPENFISSRELQPWLMLLRERIEDFGGQAILISHHPEFINVLAPQDAIQFRRNGGGPVMIRPFEVGPYQGLTPAEIVARGWENE